MTSSEPFSHDSWLRKSNLIDRPYSQITNLEYDTRIVSRALPSRGSHLMADYLHNNGTIYVCTCITQCCLCRSIIMQSGAVIPQSFFQNHHKRHPIAHQLGRDMGCFCGPNSRLYFNLVTTVMCAISYHIGSRYKDALDCRK